MNLAKIWKTRVLPAFGLLALPIGLIPTFVMFWRSRPFWPMSVDFTHLWVSGDVWARGLSPYGPAFTKAAHEHHVDLPYVYPPNWYPLSRFLDLFDPGVANWIWFIASVGFIMAGSWLIAISLMRFERWFSSLAIWFVPEVAETFRPVIVASLFAGFIFATKAAATNAHLGQTGALVFFGAACLIYGAVHSGRIMMSIGLTIMLLKPQIGLPFVIALAFDRKTRLSALGALFISAAMAAPAFLVEPPLDLVRGFLKNVSAYSMPGRTENGPDSMTGVSNLLYRATGFQTSSLVWIGVATASALAGWMIIRRRLGSDNNALTAIIATLFATLLFVPVHDWDLMIFAPLAALLVFATGPALVLALFAIAPFTRAAMILEQIVPGDTWLDDQRVTATAFAFGMVFGLAALVLELRRRPKLAQGC